MSITPSKLADSLSQLQQLFTKTDKSGNGSLSKTEFTSAAKGIAGLSGASEAEAGNLFTKMDTNADGELSKTELTDGIDLAEKVQQALLMAQELMSGATLMNMIGGNTTKSDDAVSTMFSSGKEESSIPGGMNLADILSKSSTDTETTSTDAYTTMLQQLISKYTATEAAAGAPATGTGTAVTA